MAYPLNVKTRLVSFGGAATVEAGIPLHIRISTESSRSLVWVEDGYRLESLAALYMSAEDGQEIVFEVPTTDQNGWLDAATRQAIIVDPGEASHLYTTKLEIFTEDHELIRTYEIGPYAVPEGPGVLDADLLNPNYDPIEGTLTTYIPGPGGVSGTIESATAVGLAAGADPTVTLGGTPTARTFAFGIPRGDKGDKGDPGDGSVNSVNGDFGPDIVLDANDVGAVPGDQYATESQPGIVEIATPTEAAGGGDGERAVAPAGLPARERLALSQYSARDYGAVGDGSANDTVALQSAIDAAAGHDLIIPPGVYMINNVLRLKEGSRIYGHGATIKRMPGYSSSLIGNYEQGDTTTTRYNGNGNIEVVGLTLDGNSAASRGNMMLFVHGHNIVVRDCTFLTCTGFHHLEFNSTDGAVAQNCRFLGFIPDPTSSYRKEAVQIDSARTGLSVGGASDGTPSRNITIEGCYFGPDERGNQAPNICVGSHNSVETGETYDNIRVLNCVGKGLRIGGVWMIDAHDLVVSGNSFTLQYMTPVHHNEAGIKLAGVALQSSINSSVEGNFIYSTSSDPVNGIELREQSARSIVRGNVIEYGDVGILIEQSDNCVVDANLIRHSWVHAIFSRISYNTHISNNHLVSPGASGQNRGMIFLGGTTDRASQLHMVIGNYGTPPASPATNNQGVEINQYAERISIIANRFRGAGMVHSSGTSIFAEANTTT